MSYTPLRRSTNKRYLVVVSIVVIIVAACLISAKAFNWWPFEGKITQTPIAQTGEFSPPTEEEKSAGDKQKDEIIQKEQDRNTSDQPGSGKKNVSVIITDAGQYDNAIEVRAFIPDYYQDGTCTITLTKDSHTVTKTTPAYRDASTTICTNPLFARSEFPVSGDWQVNVKYSSAGADGTSATQKVKVN